MNSDANERLIGLLADPREDLRMLALHFLCEGYMDQETVLTRIFEGWDRWGVADAFPEFPMLSYVPIPASQIDVCCRRAEEMVSQRGLTDPITRCAGKLIEQVASLPPRWLEPHREKLRAVVQRSKIFFRVDLAGLEERIAWASLPADALAERLEEALATLAADATNHVARESGLRALEALRREHPDYLDLSSVLSVRAPNSGLRAEAAGAASFQLTLQSLIQFPQPGLESLLAQHLDDPRESVHTGATEALVRAGTIQAAREFIQHFHAADLACRRWMARGLQRIRVMGLAEEIAGLRQAARDAAVWMMLLVAEVRQFDPGSQPRIEFELDCLPSRSPTLEDALRVYRALQP